MDERKRLAFKQAIREQVERFERLCHAGGMMIPRREAVRQLRDTSVKMFNEMFVGTPPSPVRDERMREYLVILDELVREMEN